MKPGSLNFNWFGGGIFYSAYTYSDDGLIGEGSLRMRAKAFLVREFLLDSVGCLDSGLL